MLKPSQFIFFAVYLMLTACVTVNVYFPAAAAEKAADLFIRDIYGDEQNKNKSPAGQGSETEAKPGAWLNPVQDDLLVQLLNLLIPQAQAADPDISISSPAINRLQASMRARHQQLVSFYNNGALGMTDSGLLDLRDAAAVPLSQRNQLKQLLADENRERNQLYQEVAAGNGHPEWESQIRSIFARRWIGNAPAGWWFNDGRGGWRQK